MKELMILIGIVIFWFSAYSSGYSRGYSQAKFDQLTKKESDK